MSTIVMTERIARSSPKFKARLAGGLFLLTIVLGVFAQGFVSGRLIVSADAAATATNILAHRGLFQLGFTVYLIEMACQIATVALFYVLLRPVSKSVALSAAFLELTGCVIKTFARVFFIVPLFVLGGTNSSAPGGMLSGFSTQQLQGLALLLLKVNDQGAAMALAFFGFSTVLNGYLIFRSTFLPRFLGVLGMISGLGWLTFLYPPLGHRAFLFAALIGLLSSAVTIFWLLVFGVNEQRWKEKARAAASIWE
jgi:Domain of unknown function (DUF4386)